LLVDKPREERFYVFCLASDIAATRLLRIWSRRHLIEQVFRTLKSLLATDACQVHNEDVYYGHLVLRLIACFVLYYTSRVIFKGRVTMDEMVFNLKHHWSSVNCQPLYLAPSGRTLLSSDVPDASPTASSHLQGGQHELCHGLCPIPVNSSS